MIKNTYIDGRDALFLGLLATLPILGYQFGLGNQVEQFSIIRRLADPSFIPADFYVNSAAEFGPRYYYAIFLGWLVQLAPLPWVIIGLTWMCNLGLASVSFDAARRHQKANRVGAAITALIVIVNSSFALGLASYIRFDSFQPANIAIVFSLIGISALISERRIFAALMFGAAAIVHPLIGVETAVIAYAACGIIALFSQQRLASLMRYVPSGLIFSAIILVAWALPIMNSEAAHISSAEFFDILPTFRAPHHYLAGYFPKAHYLLAGLFTASLAYFALHRGLEDDWTPPQRTLILMALIIIALCMASAVFVDMLHNRAWVTAQVFRNLYILKWIGFLFFGWAAGRWISRPGPLFAMAALMPILASGEAQPVIMTAAILATLVGAVLTSKAWHWGIAALLALCALLITRKFGVMEESSRALIGAACLWLFYQATWRPNQMRVVAIGLVATLLALGAINRKAAFTELEIFQPSYGWADITGADVSISTWVHDNTPADSIWVTPPDFERFRLLAERAIIADYTSIPFENMAMRDWRERMDTLYGPVTGGGFVALGAMDEAYHEITVERLRDVSLRYGATHAILYANTPWTGEVLFQTETYKAVRIP